MATARPHKAMGARPQVPKSTGEGPQVLPHKAAGAQSQIRKYSHKSAGAPVPAPPCKSTGAAPRHGGRCTVGNSQIPTPHPRPPARPQVSVALSGFGLTTPWLSSVDPAPGLCVCLVASCGCLSLRPAHGLVLLLDLRPRPRPAGSGESESVQ